MTRKALPNVVSRAEWQAARDALLAKEKAATRARDVLADDGKLDAYRRRMGPFGREETWEDSPEGWAPNRRPAWGGAGTTNTALEPACRTGHTKMLPTATRLTCQRRRRNDFKKLYRSGGPAAGSGGIVYAAPSAPRAK